jgi:hypothetical protein
MVICDTGKVNGGCDYGLRLLTIYVIALQARAAALDGRDHVEEKRN